MWSISHQPPLHPRFPDTDFRLGQPGSSGQLFLKIGHKRDSNMTAGLAGKHVSVAASPKKSKSFLICSFTIKDSQPQK